MSWKKLWNVAVVMLIYSCTGMTAAFLSAKVSAALGLQKWSGSWWLVWLLVIFPSYNLLLLGYAFLFGRYPAFRGRYAKLSAKLKGLLGTAAPPPSGT
jgi:hypothetical protein